MKNFYYEKCRKPIHYKDLPINRRKVGVHYYYKIRKRWRNTIEKSIVTYKHIPQIITTCQTEFVLDITHPHDTTYGGQDRNKTIKCIPNASLAQMDTLVETYSKRNPSYHFVDVTINVLGVFVLNKFSTLAKNLVAVVTVSLDALNSETFTWQIKKHHQNFRSNTIKGETS